MLREYFSNDIFTLLLVLSLILVVFVRQLYALRFTYYIEILWNLRYLKFYSKNRKGFDIFSNALFINALISLSIFGYLVYTEFSETPINNQSFALYLVLGVGCFIVLKSALERMVGYVFEIPKMIDLYLFQKLTFNNYVGIVFIAINGLLLFSNLDKKLLLYIAIIVFIAINLIGFVRILRLYQKTIFVNFFYFLLYLCALEIGPYVILYKAIKDYFG